MPDAGQFAFSITRGEHPDTAPRRKNSLRVRIENPLHFHHLQGRHAGFIRRHSTPVQSSKYAGLCAHKYPVSNNLVAYSRLTAKPEWLRNGVGMAGLAQEWVKSVLFRVTEKAGGVRFTAKPLFRIPLICHG